MYSGITLENCHVYDGSDRLFLLTALTSSQLYSSCCHNLIRQTSLTEVLVSLPSQSKEDTATHSENKRFSFKFPG